MDRQDTKTEFVARRVQMFGTSNAVGNGPMILPVSREMRNRKIYFSCNFQGYTDWKARAELTLQNGSTVVERFRYNWGSIYTDYTSFNTWANEKGDLGITTGGPTYSVQMFDASATPNGPPVDCPDSIRFFGVSKVDNLVENAYSTLMLPFSWFGSIDQIRFQWIEVAGRASATPTVTANPFAEIYLGCKSIVG